jgi:transposase
LIDPYLEYVKERLEQFASLLSHSRMRDVEYVTSLDGLTSSTACGALLNTSEVVPKAVLLDNAKTVVSERAGGVVRFRSDLLQYAAIVGFQPRACWVEDLGSKGKIESTISYVQRNFYYGRTFETLEEMNDKALRRCEEVNREVHST